MDKININGMDIAVVAEQNNNILGIRTTDNCIIVGKGLEKDRSSWACASYYDWYADMSDFLTSLTYAIKEFSEINDLDKVANLIETDKSDKWINVDDELPGSVQERSHISKKNNR